MVLTEKEQKIILENHVKTMEAERARRRKQSRNNKVNYRSVKERGLGYKPINEHFDGCTDHHLLINEFGEIDLDIVIRIPSMYHNVSSFRHRGDTGEGMVAINEFCANWYVKTYQENKSYNKEVEINVNMLKAIAEATKKEFENGWRDRYATRPQNIAWCKLKEYKNGQTDIEEAIKAYEAVIAHKNKPKDKHNGSKYTEGAVLGVYKLAWSGQLTNTEIGKKYNMTEDNVSAIKNGKSWNTVTHHKENLANHPEKYTKILKTIPKAIKLKVCELYDADSTQKEIAQKCGVSRSAVYQILRMRADEHKLYDEDARYEALVKSITCKDPTDIDYWI